MRNEQLEKVEYVEDLPTATASEAEIIDYSEILRFLCAEFANVDYYYQVGKITQTQGWILHISAIGSQVPEVLGIVLPELIKRGVPFKIPVSKDAAKDLLDGHLGYAHIGKIITIYPEDEQLRVNLCSKLIDLTRRFKGPAIPTDAHLGGLLYTRYGSFSPIVRNNAQGRKERYIYDSIGNVVRDEYTIPFQLPEGIKWPFYGICDFKVVKRTNGVLKHKYRSISTLKADARGNVFKGVYFKRLFRVSSCLIKEGNQYMCSDDQSRDIRDRLLWQQELHNRLKGQVSLPEIIDFFEEGSKAYLVMEFIKGVSLHDLISTLHNNTKGWRNLSKSEQLTILHHSLALIQSVKSLHEAGVVHRDITPVNFLINSKNQLVLIDIELAYSIRLETPDPPFGFGTPGFVSPEQAATLTPTIKEDIYGLSATMIFLLLGLTPLKYSKTDRVQVRASLNFLIGDTEVAALVAAGLDTDAPERPEIDSIEKGISRLLDKMASKASDRDKSDVSTGSPQECLEEHVQYGISSIAGAPYFISDKIWLSKSQSDCDTIVNQQKEYTIYVGLHKGLSGTLYFLGKAKKAGYDVSNCLEIYYESWKFIDNNVFARFPEVQGGLHYGASGVAMALKVGIETGLLQDNPGIRQTLEKCLSAIPQGTDVAVGVAGHGIAVLRCAPLMSDQFTGELLTKIVGSLLGLQNRSGTWMFMKDLNTGKISEAAGFDNGVAGIVWFLLEVYRTHPDEAIAQAVMRAMSWLTKRTGKLSFFNNAATFKNLTRSDFSLAKDNGIGMILTYIEAFEVLGYEFFKTIAEDALRCFPEKIVSNNPSQYGGLAALGEIYLEAARVFNGDGWQKRADWITQVLFHTSIRTGKIRYWLMEENSIPTADFIVGNSGILYFLMRSLRPGTLGLPILS